MLGKTSARGTIENATALHRAGTWTVWFSQVVKTGALGISKRAAAPRRGSHRLPNLHANIRLPLDCLIYAQDAFSCPKGEPALHN